MKKIALIFLVLSLVACKKKVTTSNETLIKPIEFDLPLIHGRNLDSLELQKYDDRILAFSIELGYRSSDFNKRLGLIISARTLDTDWKELIESVIKRENYQMSERNNLQYLDSLAQMIVHPSHIYMQSHHALIESHRRLVDNYVILKNYDQFKSLSAILDTVLANELAINQSLEDFEAQIKNSQAQ